MELLRERVVGGAKRVEVPGTDTSIFNEHPERSVEVIDQFVQDAWQEGEPETVLSTVLFTDIVGSTEKAAELGDHAWRDTVREIDIAGDGFFASFDGPARAIRCACALTKSVHELGLDVRAGLHTG